MEFSDNVYHHYRKAINDLISNLCGQSNLKRRWMDEKEIVSVIKTPMEKKQKIFYHVNDHQGQHFKTI